MKKLLIVIIFGLLIQVAYGQADYVVTVKSDTLRGKVKILSYDIIDRAQLTSGKKKMSYTALEVKSLFMDGQIYHSVRQDSRYRFMVLLRGGYLNLYGFRVEKQFTYDGRYLLKRDGDAMEVPNINFKKNMVDFLKDCVPVMEKIKSGEVGRKNLETLIDLYNECIDQNTRSSSSLASSAPAQALSLPALIALKEKIEKSTLGSRQDVLDLLTDIDHKTKSNQPLPNYQIEGLKGYLNNTEFKADLQLLLQALQKN